MTAIYIRTSTQYQDGGAASQLEAIKGWLVAKGISQFEIFEDRGISGAKASRPALDQLMAKVRAGDVSTVIVFALSRLARSTKHLLAILEEFTERKVSFVSITESFDTTTPMGQAMVTIISALNQLERASIRERVMAGLSRVKANGKRLGAPKKRNSDLIRELRAKGCDYRTIARLAGVSISTVSRELSGHFQKPDEAA